MFPTSSSNRINNPSSTQRMKPQSTQFSTPSPYQLRSLVMDYLCHHCYTRTAVAFARDSTVRHLDADGDEIVQPSSAGIIAEPDVLEFSPEGLRNTELRNEIRVKILSGKVDEVIELLNEHFPSVLEVPVPGKGKSAENPERSAPPPRVRGSTASPSLSPHVIPAAINPRHLLLNLRVLQFIELCRSRPLPYPPTPMPASASASEDTDLNMEPSTSMSTSTSNPTSTPPSASTPTPTSTLFTIPNSPPSQPSQGAVQTGDTDDPRIVRVVQQGQKLYTLLEQIESPTEKDIYAQELINVGALLAYPVPEEGPLAKYMAIDRREAVADQINKAILVRTGHTPTSAVELLVRFTTVVWGFANEMRIKPRPGVSIPPRPYQIGSSVQTKQFDNDQAQIVPPFNFRTFLEQ